MYFGPMDCHVARNEPLAHDQARDAVRCRVSNPLLNCPDANTSIRLLVNVVYPQGLFLTSTAFTIYCLYSGILTHSTTRSSSSNSPSPRVSSNRRCMPLPPQRHEYLRA